MNIKRFKLVGKIAKTLKESASGEYCLYTEAYREWLTMLTFDHNRLKVYRSLLKDHYALRLTILSILLAFCFPFAVAHYLQ